jgi:hypothetical protein
MKELDTTLNLISTHHWRITDIYMTENPKTKVCPVCNREFENRRKWRERDMWDEIKYCSDRCRKNS